jgi:hypothetical protein
MTSPHLDPLVNLELLASACVLAPHLYYARAEAFGVSGVWTLLNAADRQYYIQLCVELLQKVQPHVRVVTFPKGVQ